LTGPTGPTGEGIPGATGATGPAGGFGACIEVVQRQTGWYNGMASTTQQAVCPYGYTGTGGGVKCDQGGYYGSWAVPSFDASASDNAGHNPVNGWQGACGTGATTIIAVCCPACPSCTEGNNYGAYTPYTPEGGQNPPPPPPPPPPAM
jgi:hypothetical protein